MPNLLAADALRKLGIPSEQLSKEFPAMLKAGLDRLYALQHEDGGWGWFDRDPVDPFMTASAVLGLAEAKRLGSAVDSVRLERGEKRARELAALEKDPNRLAFICYALSRSKACPQVDRLVEVRESITPYALAAAAIALERWGRPEAAAFRKSLAGRARDGHWETKQWYYKWENVDIETTALAVQALVEAEPGHPLVPKACEWILSQRRGDHWRSTKDTAAAIHAVLGYTLATGGKLDLLASAAGREEKGSKLLKRARVILGGASREVLVDLGDPAASRFETRFSGREIQLGRGLLAIDGPPELQFEAETELVAAGCAKTSASGVSIGTSYDRPLSELRIGDEVEASIALAATTPCDYVMVESPIPAGCEVVRGSGAGPCARFEARHDKAIFFLRSIGAGPARLSYRMRSTFAGRYTTASPSAAVMYDESIGGSGAALPAVIRN